MANEIEFKTSNLPESVARKSYRLHFLNGIQGLHWQAFYFNAKQRSMHAAGLLYSQKREMLRMNVCNKTMMIVISIKKTGCLLPVFFD
jgi:hypothetical protein